MIKLKKILSVFISIVFISLTFFGCGKNNPEVLKDSEIIGTETTENYVFDVFKDYVVLADYIGKEANITLPEEYKNKQVKSIGDYAVSSNDILESVYIPSNIVHIGQFAFSNCENLKEVKFEKGVVEINNNAFENDDKLTSVKLPDSLVSLGGCCFNDCDKLEKVTIPDTVKNIGGGCFYFTSFLENKKEEFVFAGDNILIYVNSEKPTVTLPENTKQVSAFYDNYFLCDVIFNEKLESIGEMCFANCGQLSKIELPQSVKSVGKCAFAWCQRLSLVKLSQALNVIETEAFTDCSKIEKIIIPKSIDFIGERIFQRCENLKSITFENPNFKIQNKLFESNNDKAVIYAKSKSNVFKYCEENNYKFKLS